MSLFHKNFERYNGDCTVAFVDEVDERDVGGDHEYVVGFYYIDSGIPYLKIVSTGYYTEEEIRPLNILEVNESFWLKKILRGEHPPHQKISMGKAIDGYEKEKKKKVEKLDQLCWELFLAIKGGAPLESQLKQAINKLACLDASVREAEFLLGYDEILDSHYKWAVKNLKEVPRDYKKVKP